MSRPRIPDATKLQLLYLNADTCCVCRQRRAQHIHHLNENSSDHRIENLACLCLQCHSEAHTKHQLTQNLTPDRVSHAKTSWEAEVLEASQTRITSGNSDRFMVRAWCYFNFAKICSLISAAGYPGQTGPRFNQLRDLGLTDAAGLPLLGPNRAESAATLFQTLEFKESHWLERGFAELVDGLIGHARPIELARIWKRQAIKDMVRPGSLAFLNAGLYFKKLDHDSSQSQRSATYARNGITASFQFDTWNVSTSSCLHLHFTGHRRAGALLLVRSVEIDPELPKSPLHITATPIAMGVGFPLFEDRKPAIAYAQEWESMEE